MALTPYQARALLMGAEEYEKAARRRRRKALSPEWQAILAKADGDGINA